MTEKHTRAALERGLQVGWPSFLIGAVFMILHLAFQIIALQQSYLTGMAHFDDPLSRQAAWESRFWEQATTVATFPFVRLWEHLPLPWRMLSVVEWGILVGNSLLWAVTLVLAISAVSGLFSGEVGE
jgi:hypothetical protein